MKNRAVRIALFLLAVLAFAGAGYEVVLVENQALATRAAADAFQHTAQRLSVAVRELRAAQYAYVAPGQGTSFWTGRADTLLAAIKTQLASLCTAAAGENGRPGSGDGKRASASCFDAQNDLAAIERGEANVRTELRGEQAQMAADRVFGDLLDANLALLAHVEEIRASQAAADGATAAVLRTRQLATVGGAAVFGLLILLLLTPRTSTGAAAQATTNQAADNRDAFPASSLPLHGGHLSITMPPQADVKRRDSGAPPADRKVRPVADRVSGTSPSDLELRPAAATRESATTQPQPASRWPAAPDVVGTADLSAAATLCTDLAQLHEPADLQVLLERVAKLMDAAGIVVWVDDAACGELRPALSHGYPPQALARMRGISRNDDNATASAFRDRVLRIVPGDAHGNGAVAVPLLGRSGCVGVMAAEIRGGRECDRSTQALATILGAQLATLVNPQPAETEMGAAGEMRLQ